MSSGNKYHRKIFDTRSTHLQDNILVDVYAVLEAFQVHCPARQHAIKKLLCSGIRGKGDTIQDLTESVDSINRAIQLQKVRNGQQKQNPSS